MLFFKALIATIYLIIDLYYFKVNSTTTIDTSGLGGSRGIRGSPIKGSYRFKKGPIALYS